MIAWLTPGAFVAMALLAGPLIVHLLARRNARRIVFPATPFVRPTQAAAVRLRRPSDLALLCVRLAIVAAAVLAAARPLVVTRWRAAEWNARVSRAIVVDSTSGAAASPARQRLANQESASAFRSVQIESFNLDDALARAARWLAAAPPSRREVVVISDFRMGALDRESLGVLPVEAGIRFVRAATPPVERGASLPTIAGWRDRRWQPTVTVNGEGTRTSWTALPGQPIDWLTVAAPPSDSAAADRARRAAISFGVPPGDDTQKVLVAFAGADEQAGQTQAVRTPWMARAARSLRESDLLAAVDVPVAVEERGGTLVVRAPIAASSAAAPAVIRAVLLAVRPAAIADRTLETVTIPDAQLSKWRRDAAPVAPDVTKDFARGGGAADGETASRWFWALALLLIGIETVMRRRPRRVIVREAHADAA